MKLISRFTTLFLLAFSPLAFVFGEVPVMLMVKSGDQLPSHGCDFVKQVTTLVHNAIMEKKVKLWDSPDKEIQIMPAALHEIEKNASIGLKDIESIFIYELWTQNRKEVSTKTVGISFTNRSEDVSKNISFGYVDYNELEQIFQKSKIPTNANGNYNSTFVSYSLGHTYAFNIVQFEGNLITSPLASDELIKSYTKGLPFNKSVLGYYPPAKYVSSIIDIYTEEDDSLTYFSNEIPKTFTKYLNENQEEFFNIGGDNIFSHLESQKIKVSKVEINEIWRIIGDNLHYTTQGIIVHINGQPMNEMSFEQLKKMDLFIDEHRLTDIIESRNFNYIITKINSQEIKRQDSYNYQKSLIAKKWDNTIEQSLNY